MAYGFESLFVEVISNSNFLIVVVGQGHIFPTYLLEQFDHAVVGDSPLKFSQSKENR